MAEPVRSAVLIAALAAAVLTGCATGQPPQEEATVDITTATQQLREEFDAVQGEFGGEWEVQDLGAPLDCLDQEGAASRATRYGVPGDDSATVYDAARTRWSEEGYVIEERTDPDGAQRLFASKDDGTLRQIALGTNSIMLQGTTACLPR